MAHHYLRASEDAPLDLPFLEDFPQSDGSPWRDAWTPAGLAGLREVRGGAGRITPTAGSAYAYAGQYLSGVAPALAHRVTALVQLTSSTEQYAVIAVRSDGVLGTDNAGHTGVPRTGYWAALQLGGIFTGRNAAGAFTDTGAVSVPAVSTGAWVWVELVVTAPASGPHVMTTRVWPRGGTRPAAPTQTFSDSSPLTTAGRPLLGAAAGQAGAAEPVLWEDATTALGSLADTRTSTGTARATATATATTSSTRASTGTAAARAGATASTATARSSTGAAAARVGATSTTTTARTSTGAARAAATAAGTTTTTRSTTGTATATATASAVTSGTVPHITTGTATATATASAVTASTRATTGTAPATASTSAGTASTRTSTGTAVATARASAVNAPAPTPTTTGVALATATASSVTTTRRSSTGVAAALALTGAATSTSRQSTGTAVAVAAASALTARAPQGRQLVLVALPSTPGVHADAVHRPPPVTAAADRDPTAAGSTPRPGVVAIPAGRITAGAH